MAAGSGRAHQHKHSQQHSPAASLLSSTASRCSAWAARFSNATREEASILGRRWAAGLGLKKRKLQNGARRRFVGGAGDKLREPIEGQWIGPQQVAVLKMPAANHHLAGGVARAAATARSAPEARVQCAHGFPHQRPGKFLFSASHQVSDRPSKADPRTPAPLATKSCTSFNLTFTLAPAQLPTTGPARPEPLPARRPTAQAHPSARPLSPPCCLPAAPRAARWPSPPGGQVPPLAAAAARAPAGAPRSAETAWWRRQTDTSPCPIPRCCSTSKVGMAPPAAAGSVWPSASVPSQQWSIISQCHSPFANGALHCNATTDAVHLPIDRSLRGRRQ